MQTFKEFFFNREKKEVQPDAKKLITKLKQGLSVGDTSSFATYLPTLKSLILKTHPRLLPSLRNIDQELSNLRTSRNKGKDGPIQSSLQNINNILDITYRSL